jgi:hypothetical protein
MTVSRKALGAAVVRRRELWRLDNKNALSEVAREVGVTYHAVRLVFKGFGGSRDKRIEKALAAKGCPGFEEETIAV